MSALSPRVPARSGGPVGLVSVVAGLLVMALLGTGCTTDPFIVEPARAAPPPLYIGDVETGDLSQFRDTPWNTVVAEEPTVVDDVSRDGDYSVRMAIPAGASTDNFGARSEVEPLMPDFRSGDDLYFAFSTMLGPDFPIYEEWQNIAAWKSDPGGAPPLDIGVESGQFVMSGGWARPGEPLGRHLFEAYLGEAVVEEWVDWVVHVRFSTDPEEGFVELWRDGELVVEGFSPSGGTLYPVRSPSGVLYPSENRSTDGLPRGWLKTGYYRRSGIEPPGVVYFDRWRLGNSFDSVTQG